MNARSQTTTDTTTDADALPTILVVDDTPSNLSLITGLLKGRYRVKVANSGDKALRSVHSDMPPDLVLLDIMMPGIDGIEVCRRLKQDPRTRHIPVIFLTAMSKSEDERVGLEAGAVDYITKPISPPILLARVATHLKLKASADFLKDKNAYLESEVYRRTREVQAIQDVTILTMASLAETRDNETGNHIRRTQHYVKALAHKLREHPRFVGFFTDSTIELLFKSAPLHDIGKVGIPDRILLKPGKLTPDEFEVMKTHAALGREAIEQAEQQLGTPVEFLRFAKEIAAYHHEKWDGSGYPERLAGDAIPVAARLMAVADVYDALISRRVYKPPFGHDKAVALITEGRGKHFDPDIIDAFLAILGEFQDIARRYADTDGEIAEQARRMEAVATG
jgi:putative two-component system response regulator